MVFFITVLRALAACLITNAHYTGIYPTDIIANGVVQYALIEFLRPYFKFPLNWIVITAAILIAALLLNYVCKMIYRCVDDLCKRLLKMRNKV